MATPSQPLLNHCAIYAHDLDRSIAFYGRAFGLALKNRWQEIVLIVDGQEQRLSMPGAHLEDGAGRLIEIFATADEAGSHKDEKPVNHFAFEVADVASAFQTALAAGAQQDSPPATVVVGSARVEIAFIRGPDGERIELLRFL